MKQPHIHAALIHAWADGDRIQHSTDGGKSWRDCIESPQWNANVLYRIAPAVIKYRRYLCNNGLGHIRLSIFHYDSEKSVKDCENNVFFIKWIDTEWQEVEAEV